MIFKDTKIKLFNFLPYECTAVEEFLEDMAEKGWLVQSVTGNFFKFKKIKPRKIKFAVDVFHKISMFDYKDNDLAREYRSYCQAAGWNFVDQTGKVQIFYADDYNNALPIHTDQNEKFKSVLKSSIYYVISQLFAAIMLMAMINMHFFRSTVDYQLSSNLSIISALMMSFVVFINIIQFISFLIWVIKAKGKLKENKFMHYNSYKQLKRKNMFTSFFVIIAIMFMVLSLSSEGDGDLSIVFLVQISFPIITAICIQKFINKKKYSKITNMIITIGSVIISIYLVFMFINFSIFNNITTDFEKESLGDNIELTLVDFGFKEDDENPYIDVQESILAERTRYMSNNDTNSLDYTILKSEYPWVIKFHENRLLSFLDDIGYGYEMKETILSSKIKVYGNDNEGSYLLVSEDMVIEVRRDFFDISEEEFLDKVYKKFFSKLK